MNKMGLDKNYSNRRTREIEKIYSLQKGQRITISWDRGNGNLRRIYECTRYDEEGKPVLLPLDYKYFSDVAPLSLIF